jgi:hypothetical protein
MLYIHCILLLHVSTAIIKRMKRKYKAAETCSVIFEGPVINQCYNVRILWPDCSLEAVGPVRPVVLRLAQPAAVFL